MGGNGDKERYLFSPTKRIAKGRSRSGRTTPEGYWKTSMGDQPIRHKGKLLGYKKTSRTEAEKTTWIMHEYRLVEDVPNDLVVCKIHDHKKGVGTNVRDHRTFTSDQDTMTFAQDLENLLKEEEPIAVMKKPSLPQVVTRFEDLF